MSKYLLMGDIHLSDTPPSSCTDSYNDDIFDLLIQTIALAEGCDGVVWAGDIFHIKTPSRTTHRTVSRVIEIAGCYPCPLWIVPGNHDLSNDRLGSIEEGQPLGTVFASGAARLLDGWDDDEYEVFGVPWLRRFTDETVQQALKPAVEHMERLLYNSAPNLLVVTHAPLFPPGAEPPFEHYPSEAYSDALQYPGFSVYYGHIHDAHGIYQAGHTVFCNPGAVSRGSLTESNLSRVPSVAYWEHGRFQIVPLKAKPGGDVFRVAEAIQTRTKALSLETFLDAVGETQLGAVSVEGVIDHVRGLGLGEDIDALVQELLGARP